MQVKNNELNKGYYDESYFSPYYEDKNREIMYEQEIDRIQKYKLGGRILDVGCGIGGFLNKLNSDNWDKYGVEISDYAVDEAVKCGIKIQAFNHAYDYPEEYFDVVVFRGTIQNIPMPFHIIDQCIRLLSNGGLMVFLATPNSNSPYYRKYKTLPFITPHLNFLVPSDIMLKDALTNFGMSVENIHYPYRNTPYAKPIRDILLYILSFVGLKSKFPFWKSFMEIYAIKKG